MAIPQSSGPAGPAGQRPPLLQGSPTTDHPTPVVVAEETAFSSTIGALARTSATIILRIVPRIPAAKFFRPKTVATDAKTPSVPIPKHGQLSHLIWHVAGGAALFGVYGFALEMMGPTTSVPSSARLDERVNSLKSFLAGAASGISFCLLTHPVYNLHYAKHLPCHGTDIMAHSWSQTKQIRPPLRTFFRGISASLFYDTLGYGLFFLSYESVRQALDENYNNYSYEHRKFSPEQSSLTTALHATLAGCCAGLALEIVHHPIQTAQHHLAMSDPTHVSSRLVPLSTAFACLRERGLSFAFAGFPRHAARAIPSSSAAFLAYELSLLWLRKCADPTTQESD